MHVTRKCDFRGLNRDRKVGERRPYEGFYFQHTMHDANFAASFVQQLC